MAITRYFHEDVVPPTAMVVVESSVVVSSILFKAAASKGLSYYVFIAYTCMLCTLALFPPAIFHIRKRELPPFKFPLVSRLFLLALITFSAELTFILAVFFRSSSRAKIIGTIVSLSGAFVIVLYKGPKVSYTSNWSSSSAILLKQSLESSQSVWVIGGILLVVGCLSASFFYIIQIYPEETVVSFINRLFLVILSVPVCILAESNKSSWRLTPSIVVASVLYSGILSDPFALTLNTWCIRIKGPVYVSMFKPLTIVIAAFLSPIFLGVELHLGSVIGAIILTAGIYALIWGKANEEKKTENDDSGSSTLSDSKVPLL